MSSKLPLRKFMRRVHLWLGLSVGVLLTLICLSGAAVMFYVEIDQGLHAEQLSATSSKQSPNWDQALATVRLQYPDKTGPWRFEVTPSGSTIPARYYNPPETQGEGFAPLLVWLSSDGKQLLRQDYWGHTLMTWLYNLHFQLLLGDTGTLLVGYIGLVSLLLIISGLMAWWPKRGQWRKGLTFKPRNNTVGLLYDWHKLIGLAVSVPLLTLTVTGAMLALPNPTNTVLSILPSQHPQPPLFSHNPATTQPTRMSLANAINTLQQQYPLSHLAWIEVPPTSGGYYQFRLQLPSDPSRRFPHSYVQVNPNTGVIVAAQTIQNAGSKEVILSWLHPLHDGSVGGLTLRII
ncbi:PepSY-associated TM helix domain-containing protein [Shewanella sp.]|uniref:PepSY-associated TM helix domain-containing protein n=1 Tax=Shewanella sp. TaxID=50422 RepID=UPI003A969193